MIYLDNSTVTRPAPVAVEALLLFLKEHWGLFPKIQGSISLLYQLLGAKAADYFYLAPGMKEAADVIFSTVYAGVVRERGKNHFVTTAVDSMQIEGLETLGCAIKRAAVNGFGQVTRKTLEEVIRPRTAMVSLSWANGYTGVIQPIYDVAKVCREKEVLLHVDASGVIGKLFFRFQDLDIDFLSFDGKLVHAPQGCAGLFVKDKPLAEEPGMNGGMVSALAAAIETVSLHFDHLCTETARLRDKFETTIQMELPDVMVLFQQAERLPNVTAIAFPGISNQALLYALHRKGICATRGTLEQTLHACGVDPSVAHTALSFSLSYETTEVDIDKAVEDIVSCVKKLQSFAKEVQ